jgi:hypothetical protein
MRIEYQVMIVPGHGEGSGHRELVGGCDELDPHRTIDPAAPRVGRAEVEHRRPQLETLLFVLGDRALFHELIEQGMGGTRCDAYRLGHRRKRQRRAGATQGQ